MKKTLFLIALVFVTSITNAQSLIGLDYNNYNTTTSTELDYSTDTEYIINNSLSKSAMWINLKKWISSTFNSYKCVVDLEDKENGVIIIKWQAGMPEHYSSDLLTTIAEGTLQIDVRENKYRIRKSDEYISVKVNRIDARNMSTYRLESSLRELNEIKGVFKSGKIHYKDLKDEDFPSKAQLMYYDYLEIVNGKLIYSLKKQMAYTDDF